MTILGIETSCDETGIAILKKNSDGSLIILSNAVASSLHLHAKTGGVIPEIAAREQVKLITTTIIQALGNGIGYDFLKKETPQVDAIAVTYGPGLVGSLLVGVETAKTLSMLWDKPLIPINHMYGHLYANFIDDKSQIVPPSRDPAVVVTNRKTKQEEILFPAIVLIVSGGHTDLLLMNGHDDIVLLGGTRDDAAGEAFDKIGRLLNLPYPAGATIAELAKNGDPKTFSLPRPMWDSNDYDFSFSGLKTAALREVQKITTMDNKTIANLCASVEQAIVDIIVQKTTRAAKEHGVKSILLGGGVAANTKLGVELRSSVVHSGLSLEIFIPQKSLCTDNGAMIAAAGFFTNPSPSWREVNVNPQLSY